jgi:hypothetical protein
VFNCTRVLCVTVLTRVHDCTSSCARLYLYSAYVCKCIRGVYLIILVELVVPWARIVPGWLIELGLGRSPMRIL